MAPAQYILAQTAPQDDSLSGTIVVRKLEEATGRIALTPYAVRYHGEGGSLLNYGRGLVYPKQAVQGGKQGTVIASFVANPDGSVSDVTLVQEAHPFLNDGVLEHIRRIPVSWIRGRNARYTITVVFRLE